MSEIKVGEYVRTKHSIGKVENIGGLENELVYFKNCEGLKCVDKTEIKKHSPNIIDLIEIGDLIKYDSNNYGTDLIEVVNETCTVEEDYDDGEGFVCTALDDYIHLEQIKSIVTHEQFEEMEYKV